MRVKLFVTIALLVFQPLLTLAQTENCAVTETPTALDPNITVLLVGDVHIENVALPAPVTIPVTANGNVNIRHSPSTTSTIVGSLKRGEVQTATGRTEDAAWLQIQTADGQSGWVFANLLTIDDSVSSLTILSADNPAPVSPIAQTFNVVAAPGDSTCADGGVLVQTTNRTTVLINDFTITFDSTLYVQNKDESEMTINVLDGTATVLSAPFLGNYNYQKNNLPAGARIRIPVNSDHQLLGYVSDVEPYDSTMVAGLSLDKLQRPVHVLPALTTEALAPYNPVFKEIVTADQNWVNPNICGLDSYSMTYGNMLAGWFNYRVTSGVTITVEIERGPGRPTSSGGHITWMNSFAVNSVLVGRRSDKIIASSGQGLSLTYTFTKPGSNYWLLVDFGANSGDGRKITITCSPPALPESTDASSQ